MAIVFPTNLDTFVNPIDSNTLSVPNHATEHSDINDAVEALEAKVGKDGSNVTTSHDYKLQNVTGATTAIPDTGATITSPSIYSAGIFNSIISAPSFSGSIDGWITASTTWTYNAANVFNVGGIGNSFQAGDYIKWIQPSGTKYGIVISNTPTSITIATNTDYVIANEAVSYNAYSRQLNPLGIPRYFNYTPTIAYSGGSADPTSNTINHAYFMVEGKRCFFSIKSTMVIGSGDRTLTTYTLPITRANTDHIMYSSWSSFNSTNLYGIAYSDTTTLVKVPITIDQSGVNVITGFYWI